MKNRKNFFKMIVVTMLILFTIGIGNGDVKADYTSSYSEPSILVSKGAVGNSVRWIQEMLNYHGYSLSIDGIFGINTRNAVIQFQASKGLIADGIVGPLTRKKLKENNITVVSVNEYRYTSSAVNFRSGPGTNYSSKGILYSGTKVFAYNQRNDGWSYVKYDGNYGYISTKYITKLKSGLPTFKRNNSYLIPIIQACKAYYATNNFYYSTASGVRSIPADASKPQGGTGKYYTDCSNFVSWTLYEYARANGKTDMRDYFSIQKSSSIFASIGAAGGNKYLSVVSAKKSNQNVDLSQAKVGDIIVTTGHVEFFASYISGAGNRITMKVYNCGSDASLKNAGITYSGTNNVAAIQYILRVK